MTEEEFIKKYDSKSIKELCNEWRKKTIEKFESFKYVDCTLEIKWTKETLDEEIIKYALGKLLEE